MEIHTSPSMNEDEPPFKRRRLTFIRRQMTILMLPDDLILNCLARISRLYYPTLSLVSKKFRSLLTSVELYQTRTLLGCTESCLYVCLQLRDNPNTLRWFTLCRIPNSSRNILVPISSPGSLSAPWSDVAMVGHDIYIIGGLMDNNESSSVMVFDCYSHTLRKAPSMHITRLFPSACVFDKKIYVTGGSYENLDSTNWIEVFDTKTHTWEFLHIPCEDLSRGYKFKSVGHEGTVFVMSKDKNVTYKLHKGKWRAADIMMNLGWNFALSYCVIDNVFYRCNDIKIYWYDPQKRSWKVLKGLGKIPKFSSNVKMMDYGGRMGVLWEEDGDVSTNKHKKRIIWFAEITIDKQQNGEIWGTVNWSDIVSTTIEPYSLVHALATTI